MLLQRVFVDANVFVSRTTRDWLFMLRENTEGMFQVHCTEDVLAETISSLRNLYPRMSGGQMADILLSNDKGFLASDGTPYELFNCDEFFILADDSAPWLVRNTVLAMNLYWQSKNPPGRKSLTKALMAAGCSEFAKRVEGHLRTLSGPIRR